ncbi:hypothetical protein [Streptomyces sp. GESEQ-35]|uniref:hypothetical protein n=1 Tax=Streptomyces sp. GESEQ-35 TaxID=2812657 RepID=UPI001B3283A9|nr:hypothetical protein [Streptomyces sp. GESEQ-35]
MRVNKFVVAAAAVAGQVLLLASPAVAGAAAPEGKYCAVQLGKSSAGKNSPVVAQACSNTSLAEAKATMQIRHQATTRARGETAAAAPVALMYLYENVNYNRDSQGDMTAVYVPENCDTAGYRFEPVEWWKNNVSSVAGGSTRCNTSRVYNKAQTSSAVFKIHVEGDGRWLGGYSDNVHHFQTYWSLG